MEDELILRQQAVELFLKGDPVNSIVHKLGRSRQWVHKWITRYRTEGGDDWYLSRPTSPKQARNRTPPKEEEVVINVRKALAGLRYSQTGALSIMYEIERMGLKPPSIPTINRILKRNNLITPSNVKQRKGIEYPNYFTLVQQMDLEEKTSVFSDFHNQNHRYSTQGGKTPNQIKSISQKHKLGLINLEDPIPLADGSVIFIRFIRSDRSLTILRNRFTVKKELIYTYVVAEIVVDQHVLLVKQDGIIHHVFPFAMPVD